uniref:Uncharacterized protein n=1 Tax=Romanomermis culicivorax TaxID=13658 RepID=A0A915JXY9_ROMCU
MLLNNESGKQVVDVPDQNPPPKIHTMTGNFSVRRLRLPLVSPVLGSLKKSFNVVKRPGTQMFNRADGNILIATDQREGCFHVSVHEQPN